MANNEKGGVSRWVDGRLNALSPDGEWQPNTVRALSAFRERSARNSRHKYVWGTLIVTAAAALLLAHPASRVFAERCIAACRDLLSGGNGSAGGGVRISEMAPDFALTDANGNLRHLSDYRGKVVLLNFWASWCPPCKEEIPLLRDFATVYADEGFEVIGVAMDEEGWKSAKPFMEEMKINYSVVLGDESVANRYGTHAFPESYLIDREGRVAAKYVGVVQRGPVGDFVSLLLSAAVPEPQTTSQPSRIRVAGDVQATKAIRMVPPVYPPDARAKGVEANVVLNAIIGASGTVKELAVLSGDSVFASAAITAVRQWVYRPTLLNGEPVEVETTIRVTFTLHEPGRG